MPAVTWCPERRRFHRCSVCLLRSTGPAESGHYCSNCGSRHSKDHIIEIFIGCQLLFTMQLCVVCYKTRTDNGKLHKNDPTLHIWWFSVPVEHPESTSALHPPVGYLISWKQSKTKETQPSQPHSARATLRAAFYVQYMGVGHGCVCVCGTHTPGQTGGGSAVGCLSVSPCVPYSGWSESSLGAQSIHIHRGKDRYARNRQAVKHECWISEN